jgi:hypothetical protein
MRPAPDGYSAHSTHSDLTFHAESLQQRVAVCAADDEFGAAIHAQDPAAVGQRFGALDPGEVRQRELR